MTSSTGNHVVNSANSGDDVESTDETSPRPLREYFDTDNRHLSISDIWKLMNADGKVVGEIPMHVVYDFTANAKYWYVFFSHTLNPVRVLHRLLQEPRFLNGSLDPEGDGVDVKSVFSNYPDTDSSATLVFTRRIQLYADCNLSSEDIDDLKEMASQHDLVLTVRDRTYARIRSEAETPIAFISHDSRDKDTIVRDLARELTRLDCPVWYDEYSLRVGDSLRASIESGLKQAKKCILVLSPNFLSNDGWPRAEFDSVFTREILERKNVILPVWHHVEADEVYNYSPRLADKFALQSSIGVEELAKKLAAEIKSGN